VLKIAKDLCPHPHPQGHVGLKTLKAEETLENCLQNKKMFKGEREVKEKRRM